MPTLQRLYAGDPTLAVLDAQGRRLLSEPAGGIGLQACRLVVEPGEALGGQEGGGPVEFEAGAPWWRRAEGGGLPGLAESGGGGS